MRTLSAMLGPQGLFWDLLILHLSLWSILGENPCVVQILIKRHSKYSVSPGEVFEVECPVEHCGLRPNVTWCKFSGRDCLHLGDPPHVHTSWKEKQNTQVFILHFEPVHPTDNGSYVCWANLTSGAVVRSHSIIINVTALPNIPDAMPNISDATSASGPPSVKETADRPWLFYSLLPLGGLLLLLLACFFLVRLLRRHQGKQMKSSDLGRDVNMVDIPVSSRQNSQTLSSETEIYDNDPWFRIQEVSEAYSNSQLEGDKQGIVYASLNHSVIGRNPRQARTVQEAPTEYASVCVRS